MQQQESVMLQVASKRHPDERPRGSLEELLELATPLPTHLSVDVPRRAAEGDSSAWAPKLTCDT